jgi:hypothetical protein
MQVCYTYKWADNTQKPGGRTHQAREPMGVAHSRRRSRCKNIPGHEKEQNRKDPIRCTGASNKRPAAAALQQQRERKRRVEREREGGHDGTYKWAVLKPRRRKKSQSASPNRGRRFNAKLGFLLRKWGQASLFQPSSPLRSQPSSPLHHCRDGL